MTETGTDAAPSRRWLLVTLSFAAAWCVFLYFFGPKLPGRAPILDGTRLSRPADYGWTLSDLEGRPVDFARYRGKTVFLNIWATWCGPCVAELPSIVNLARSPRLADVAFVCVSVDEDAGAARRFLRGRDWPMTMLRATALPPAFTTDGIPASFLIAPDGRIAASALGGAEWDDPSVVEFLERLAREPKLPEQPPQPAPDPPAAAR